MSKPRIKRLRTEGTAMTKVDCCDNDETCTDVSDISRTLTDSSDDDRTLTDSSNDDRTVFPQQFPDHSDVGLHNSSVGDINSADEVGYPMNPEMAEALKDFNRINDHFCMATCPECLETWPVAKQSSSNTWRGSDCGCTKGVNAGRYLPGNNMYPFLDNNGIPLRDGEGRLIQPPACPCLHCGTTQPVTNRCR